MLFKQNCTLYVNMNINSYSISNIKSSSEVSHKDTVTSTGNRPMQDDERSGTTNVSTSREQHGASSSPLSMRNFNAFKSYILSSEKDAGIYQTTTDLDYLESDHEPMFVIVDSSCISNPSSKELLIDNRYNRNTKEKVLEIHFNKNVKPVDVPSTSKDLRTDLLPQLKDSDSIDEMQMMDINLQSDNELSIADIDCDNDSIVISYLKNKDTFLDFEELSESSLNVIIPSTVSSLHSLISFKDVSKHLSFSTEDKNDIYKQAIEFLHHDNPFLIAAELGDEDLLRKLIDQGAHINDKDHLGRNALHLAVCTGNRHAVALLLNAGVNPNVKDNLGMTPLSLCLMRRPSWRMANLLFDYGAILMTRIIPMDTGLFLQFVMMCIPTREEERILHLLVEKGALVNDPDAPGGRQALHFAAMSNNTHLINILVDLGANLFDQNHRNETPKEVAATFRCKDAYEILVQYEELCKLVVESNISSSDSDASNASLS